MTIGSFIVFMLVVICNLVNMWIIRDQRKQLNTVFQGYCEAVYENGFYIYALKHGYSLEEAEEMMRGKQ